MVEPARGGWENPSVSASVPVLAPLKEEKADEKGFLAEITGLLDKKAAVQLVNISPAPNNCPKGYKPEYIIVQAARTSYGLGLKDPKTDAQLINYLFRHKHTSPFEMASATFRLVVPKFVAIQILRHRTGKFNEFSLRYAELPEENAYYNPLDWEEGIRPQSKTNNQGSEKKSAREKEEGMAWSENIAKLFVEMNGHITAIDKLYREAVKLGCAKEIARYALPVGAYTTLYVQFDLSNLIKFFRLRCEEHAQLEIQIIANAMQELVRPYFPTVFKAFDTELAQVAVTAEEGEIIFSRNAETFRVYAMNLSKTAKLEFIAKAEKFFPEKATRYWQPVV